MFKKAFCASVLAAVCNLANATTPTHWDFSWTGVFDTLTFQFIDATVAGSFEGTDLDSNGEIDLSELTAFRLQGRDVLGCISSPPITCGVSEFSYTPGGAFKVLANHVSYWDDNGGPNWSSNEISLDTTAGFFAMIGRAQQFYDERDWMFTSETRFSISPVPESGMYSMLLAGLALLAAVRRKDLVGRDTMTC